MIVKYRMMATEILGHNRSSLMTSHENQERHHVHDIVSRLLIHEPVV